MSNVLGDVILQNENIAKSAIILLGPQVMPLQRINELCCDPNAVSRPLHAALEHIANPKLLSHLLDFDLLALVGECRVAGDHEQV
jgi:hypothetical protein